MVKNRRWMFVSLLALMACVVALPLIACDTKVTPQETTADGSSNTEVTTEPVAELAQESSQESTAEPAQETTGTDASESVVTPETEPEIPTVGEVSNPDEQQGRCGGAAVKEWPLHDAVSTGKIQIVQQGPPIRATIDASAGGSPAARSNPFVYLNLKTGQKVEINDKQALNSDDWDLAFKRVVIRSNSGDSGTGDREVARLTNTDLGQVNQVPADNTFRTDVYFDLSCQLITDPIGTPVTAFNLLNTDNSAGSQSWYDYGGGGAGGVNPVSGHVYVIRRKKTGEAFKLQIISWQSGVFTLLWQAM